MASKHHLISASQVEGVPVFSPAGDRLGRIDDILIEKASGEVAYALMSFDGFLGVGERFYPIPWSALTYSMDEDGYVAPLTRADVKKAPSVSDREVLEEVRWREQLHDFYRAAPNWLSPRGNL